MSKLKYLSTAPLQDMPRDLFVLLARDWLDWKDVARLDTAMCSREGRFSLLEALRSGVVIYEGSKGEYDKLSVACLRWLSLRGIGLRYLSVNEDVSSSLAFAVARNSPTLKCLHMNYDVANGLYLEQLEAHCPELEETLLRCTCVVSRVDQGTLMVELTQGFVDQIFCERPRLHGRDGWCREPANVTQGGRFSWRRFLYNKGLLFSAIFGWITAAKHIIKSDVCNINAQDINGETALFFASYDYLEIVKLILQKDHSSIDTQTVYCKKTALMRACEIGRSAIIELLIRSGANLDLKDHQNKTAFQLLDEFGGRLSKEEKTRLKDLPRLIRQEQLQKQMQS